VGLDDASAGELTRLYGPWAPNTPADAARLFADYGGIWWVAGGWAIEAFNGTRRQHGDLDLSVLRRELPLLRSYLTGRLDVWTAADGALRPLLPNDEPTATADDVLPADCEQVWTRRSGSDPWEYDILLAPGDRDVWIYKRDPTIWLPMADALWERAGTRYLRPEIQLLYKAKRARPKDQTDFTNTLPHLDDMHRAWLRASLVQTLPEHPWIARL
jgi:hypothetical protein